MQPNPFPSAKGVRFVRIAAKRRPCAERSILDWKRVAHDRAAGESTASCRKCLPRLVSQCSGPLRRSSEIDARRPKFTSNYSPNTTGSNFPTEGEAVSLASVSGPAPVGPGGREEFIAQAAARSLQVRWSYKPTLDCWPHTSRRAPLPNAESLSQRMVTLPVYSDISENELSVITRSSA